jgi:hypothetical protein
MAIVQCCGRVLQNPRCLEKRGLVVLWLLNDTRDPSHGEVNLEEGTPRHVQGHPLIPSPSGPIHSRKGAEGCLT